MAKTSTIVISALLALASCDTIADIATENGDWFYNDEEDCRCNNDYINIPDNNSMPETGEAVIRVSREYGDVKLSIYEGDMDGYLLIDSITSGERNTVTLKLNRVYTYVARYVRGNDTIVVPVKSSLDCKSQDCQGMECYFIYNNIIDLKLRF